MSRANEPRGTARGSVSSVKTAGSLNDAPYAAVDERTTSLRSRPARLGGGEQLHRADDVLLFHRRPAAVLRVGRAGHREVHDRLGAEVGDGAGRGARVGPDQLDVRQQTREGRRRVVRIQADDAFDPGVGGQPGGHPGAEEAADPGDDDDRGT